MKCFIACHIEFKIESSPLSDV